MQTRKLRFIAFCISCLLITTVAIALTMLGAVSGHAPRAFAMPFTPPTPTAIATSTVGASIYVTPGTLSMSASGGSAHGSDVLSGNDDPVDFDLPITVKDHTGSGAGWDLTVSMTQLTNGSHTLSTNGNTVIVLGTDEYSTSDGSAIDPSNSVSYILRVPSDSSTTTKLYNAAANTGMGDFVITPTFEVNIPVSAYAGTYSSVMTISITSGP